MNTTTHSHFARRSLVQLQSVPAPQQATPQAGRLSARHIIVVSNENADQESLLDYVSGIVGRRDDAVHVVAPALNSRLNHWMSDSDSARREAESRLVRCIDAMRRRGINATGEVGDSDPIQAIADAAAAVEPDELIIATHPEHRSNWLARGMVERARERFDLAVTHFVVDGECRQQDQVSQAQAA